MKFCRKNIINLLFTILFVISLLTPSVLKISHAHTDHEDFVCHNQNKLHIHRVELDCDFEKYKVQIPFPFKTPNLQDIVVLSFSLKKKYRNQYSFLSKYQKLHFALRGPPSLS